MSTLVLTGALACATACGSTTQTLGPAGAAGSAAESGGATVDGGPAGATAAGPGEVGTGLGGAPGAGTTAQGSGTGSGGTPTLGGPAGRGTGDAAQPQQGAQAPAASASSLPGVTEKTITVGVIALDPKANKTLEDAGFGAASAGDEPANWRAAADDVNDRGGVAGRRLVLEFFLVNVTDSPSTQGQAACTKFTQDTKVAAVLSSFFYTPAHACLSKAGLPALLGVNYGVDTALARQTATVVAWATPLLDRLAAFLPDAFQKQGKLKSGSTVGILVTDAPAFTRSASALSTELQRLGLKVVVQTVRDSDSGDYSGASGDASAAVLKFRAEGVTEVMFVTRNAFEPTLLMQAANSQGYRPTYLLSTQQYPATLVGLVPPGQLAGAVAVGWAPALDLDRDYATSAQAKACLAAMSQRGRTFSNGTQTSVAMLACDGVDLLRRAAGQPQALSSQQSLLRAALAGETGFVSAVTIRTAFPDGRRDGVAAYRPMSFSDSCNCFRYTGPVTNT